jgi:hypothetical protein
MRLIQEDALDKVLKGTTTLEEVMRVVPMEAASCCVECIKCHYSVLPSFSYCPSCGTRCSTRTSPSRPQKDDFVEEGVH